MTCEHCDPYDLAMDKYARQDRDAEQGRVRCDAFCGAHEDPQTLDEALATVEHYKHHSYLSGCSHGNPS